MTSRAIALAASVALLTLASDLARGSTVAAAAHRFSQGEQNAPVTPLRLAAKPTLEGQWGLVQWGTAGNLSTPLPQIQLTLQFTNGRLSGFGGCNRFMGTYQLLPGRSLRISPLASTRKACPPPILSQEDRYLKLLTGEHQYRLTPRAQLELRSHTGTPPQLLIFQSSIADAATQSWLDQPRPQNWNRVGAAIPTPPRSENSAADFARCQSLVRPTSTTEDKALTQAGWKLYGPLQQFGPLTLATGFSSVDGMCRPLQYQGFVFLGGRFAGTLSPVPMDSRSDGAFDQALLYRDSGLEAEFRRYTPQAPLCCPSKRNRVSYRLEGRSQAPLLVPIQVSPL